MTSKINSDSNGSDIFSSSSSGKARIEIQKVDSQSKTPQTVEILGATTRIEENKTGL